MNAKLFAGALSLAFYTPAISSPAFAMSGVSPAQLQQAQAVICDVSAVAGVAASVENDVKQGSSKVATRTQTVQAASADVCAQMGGIVTALAPASAN